MLKQYTERKTKIESRYIPLASESPFVCFFVETISLMINRYKEWKRTTVKKKRSLRSIILDPGVFAYLLR